MTAQLSPVIEHAIEHISELIARAHAAEADERSSIEEEILHRYQPLTRRMASRYLGFGADFDDLHQVASMALVKAVRRFDAERGSFESFAKATISGELKRYLRDFGWSIRPPRRLQEMQTQIAQSTAALAQSDGVLPGPTELAEHLEASVADITEALTARSCYAPSSLDEPLGESGRPMGDNLSFDDEPYAEVDGHLALVQICSDLSDDDRTLIRLRFFECLSQREIAEEIGVSQMQVSRRLTSLLGRLRERAIDAEVA